MKKLSWLFLVVVSVAMGQLGSSGGIEYNYWMYDGSALSTYIDSVFIQKVGITTMDADTLTANVQIVTPSINLNGDIRTAWPSGGGDSTWAYAEADTLDFNIRTGTFTAGEYMDIFHLCYVDPDGYVYLADAQSSLTMPGLLMAREEVDYEVEGEFFLPGSIIYNFDWEWTPGSYLYASIAGAIADTTLTGSGEQVQVVGIAITATTIYFNPDLTVLELL